MSNTKTVPTPAVLNKEVAEIENQDIPFQDFDLYQMLAERSNVTPDSNRLVEILTGMTEELGEFMSFHKRMMRGDYKTPEQQQEALILASKELGDMLWYMSAWCTIHGIQFGEIPFNNLEKLRKRMEQNKITGSGDTREEDLKVVEEIKDLSSPVEADLVESLAIPTLEI